MKIIDYSLMASLSELAKSNLRLRANHNFHEGYADPSQRMLVAIEPGSYVRPHRHLATPKPEAFLVLKGLLALMIFNDDGQVQKTLILGPAESSLGVDLPVGVWHTVVCLEPETIFYETKPGPFCPIAAEDMAPWAPDAEDSQVTAYLQTLVDQIQVTL